MEYFMVSFSHENCTEKTVTLVAALTKKHNFCIHVQGNEVAEPLPSDGRNIVSPWLSVE